ncbi:TadE/TadG family type IV pilus assembly protein [Altericroceibacterium xinjiangense]|uniref:TadE/TadG family type IV pilus assembly protein n=1 Tax=Altericroceibacterium xinjiangense TaxID=762261 RepID=UPI0013DEF990|nr:TadE/TadG family type IV pilus assembly protein [Altericroceibacterium xinjiangense]
MRATWLRWFRLAVRLRADRSGVAAVELALLLPFLVLLLAGLIDYSRLIVTGMQVRSAAQAGADYALLHGWDQDGITQSVMSATTLEVTANPAPQRLQGCVSGTSIIPTTEPTCPSGAQPGEYVTASATAPFSPLMPWPGLTLSSSLSADAMARVR